MCRARCLTSTSHRHIERRAGDPADHHDLPRQRDAHSRRLGAGLRINRLIRLGIGHRDRGAVHQLDRAPAPQPLLQRLLAEQAAPIALADVVPRLRGEIHKVGVI